MEKREDYELTRMDFIPIKGYLDYSNRLKRKTEETPEFKIGGDEDIEFLMGEMKLIFYNEAVGGIVCGLVSLLIR